MKIIRLSETGIDGSNVRVYHDTGGGSFSEPYMNYQAFNTLFRSGLTPTDSSRFNMRLL